MKRYRKEQAIQDRLDAKGLCSFLGSVGASVAGSVISSVIGGALSNSAGNTQAQGQDQATALQRDMWNTQQQQTEPYRQQGYDALNRINGLSNIAPANPDSLWHKFDATDLNANISPGYQFALDQGNRATMNAANVTGGGFSGNTLKAISDYNIGAAQQGYQQAYENYNTNQGNIFNRLASIAGFGQTANAQSAGSAPGFANAIGGNIAGAAASRAGGQVGAANALGSGVNNASSWYTLSNIMGNRNGGGGSGSGGGNSYSGGTSYGPNSDPTFMD